MSSPSLIPTVNGSWSPKGGPRLHRYDILWIAGIFIAGGLVSVAVQVLGTLTMGPLTRQWQSLCLFLPEMGQAESVVATACSGLVLGWGGYSLARRRGIDATALGLRQFPGLWLLTTLILFALSFWAEVTISRWIDPTGGLGREFIANTFPMSHSVFWATMVAIANGPITALGEEILFRGLFYRWFRERMRTKIAALLSAALLAMIHFYFLSPGGFPGHVITLEIFALGLLATALYQASGSLWPPILVHALNNGAVIFVAYAPPTS